LFFSRRLVFVVFCCPCLFVYCSGPRAPQGSRSSPGPGVPLGFFELQEARPAGKRQTKNAMCVYCFLSRRTRGKPSTLGPDRDSGLRAPEFSQGSPGLGARLGSFGLRKAMPTWRRQTKDGMFVYCFLLFHVYPAHLHTHGAPMPYRTLVPSCSVLGTRRSGADGSTAQATKEVGGLAPLLLSLRPSSRGRPPDRDFTGKCRQIPGPGGEGLGRGRGANSSAS
jgi:hypothetical protein